MKIVEEYLKEFNEYKYIVLCNGLFDAGFKNLNDALDHCANQKKRYRYNNYEVYDVDGEDGEDDTKQLERIRESYESYIHYLEERENDDWEH